MPSTPRKGKSRTAADADPAIVANPSAASWYVAREIALPTDVPESHLTRVLARSLRVPERSLAGLRVLRKSLDARKRRPVWRYALEFSCAVPVRHPLVTAGPQAPTREADAAERPWPGPKVAVVGCGPAGLAAALGLSRKGYAVTVFEQGRPVAERFRDIRLFIKQNQFHPRSNILFGEGGAGTFSDGKLTARSRNRYTDAFLRELVACGADAGILTFHHPHLGTDRLQFVIDAFRRRCEVAGAVFRFDTEVTAVLLDAGRCVGVAAGNKEDLFDAVVLAPGLSAHSLYRALAGAGVALERKGFAVGARVEHPQDFINHRQFGDIDSKNTGAAEYFLTWKDADAAAYSFCMCPGGVVIPCADEPEGISTNGMSYSNRASAFANAAVVVPVPPEALPGGVLAGLDYQRDLEHRAFRLAGGNFSFPAQTVAAFVDGRRDTDPLPRTSFQKPLAPCDLRLLFDARVTQALVQAFRAFDRKIPGWIRHGLLIAPESRTSAPVRLMRRPDTLESANTPGLYPIGEGAGYAGGIVSSGADGLRLAAHATARAATAHAA